MALLIILLFVAFFIWVGFYALTASQGYLSKIWSGKTNELGHDESSHLQCPVCRKIIKRTETVPYCSNCRNYF